MNRMEKLQERINTLEAERTYIMERLAACRCGKLGGAKP